MEDRVRDRGCSPHDADLAEPLHPERAYLVVPFIDENDFDVLDIGMGGHVVFREIVVHDLAESVIRHRLLVQRHADAHDHAAEYLASSSLRIEDATRCRRTDDAGHPDDAEFFVNTSLREYSGVRITDVFLRLPRIAPSR